VNAPVSVAVVGSCGSRDSFNSVFNPDYKRFFSCDLATNQTSMITLMSPPVDVEWQPTNAMSEYDRWNVNSDLSREFLGQVGRLRPALLVLDFFADVHFGVMRLPDGRFVTDNRWKLQKTDWYQQQLAAGALTRLTMQDDLDEYLSLWQDAITRFAAHLREHSPETVVVVHRGWNTDLVRLAGQAQPVPMQQHKAMLPFDTSRGNELWAMLDDFCVDSFGWEQIDLRQDGFTTYAEHPWGPFWVHYEPAYYHRFLAELLKIDLRRSDVDPELRERMAVVEAAAHEAGEVHRRHADELAASRGGTISEQRARIKAQRARMKEQRARIEELESLGVGRALRFAVGQRLRARRQARSRTEGEARA
jgi:hypothetical protein